MKRFRISTLMFLVVIAALVVALVVERRRSARLMAEMQAERDNARMAAELATYQRYLVRLQSVTNASGAKAAGAPSK